MSILNSCMKIGIALLLVAGITGGTVYYCWGRSEPPTHKEWSATESKPISVNAIHPRVDSNFQMRVERPADVMAYNSVQLDAQVAGVVKSISVALGSWVEKNQSLVQIEVPDLQAAEQERKNLVQQREREQELAQAKVMAARVAIKTAEANVEEKKTLLQQAKAQTAYRQQQYDRLQALLDSNSVDKNVRDAAFLNLEVAKAAEPAAVAARVKAEAEVEDARENVRVMEADVKRIAATVEVARSAHQQAMALAEYANVKAPFRGTVVARHVDPGSFVQNASTGKPTPMLVLERTDIVTVVMRVPDNFAPFVNPGSEAILEIDALPGVKILGKVTRIAGTLANDRGDRTMRVEVDLWNGKPEDYKPFFENPTNLAELNKKGPLPLIPKYTGADFLSRSKHLLAGMYAKMTLVLKDFGTSHLIPSEALLRRGGRSFLYVVEAGKAHLMPVEVHVDDGTMAYVVRVDEKGKTLGGLTDADTVIVTNQDELEEGQAVEAAVVQDWGGLKDLKKHKTQD
jgi:multidrug efflux pump subunit AcrA (membrane-fusion protein)